MQSSLLEKKYCLFSAIDACLIAVLLSFLPFVKIQLFTTGYFERNLELREVIISKIKG